MDEWLAWNLYFYFFLPCYRHSDPLFLKGVPKTQVCLEGGPNIAHMVIHFQNRINVFISCIQEWDIRNIYISKSNNLGKPYLKKTILVLFFWLSVEPVATTLSVPKLSSILCGRHNVLHRCQKQRTAKKLTLILQNEPSLSSHLCRMTLGEIFRCVIYCQYLCNA